MPGVPIVSKCPRCKKVDRFEIPADMMERRKAGAFVHEAFDGLPQERILQMVTHVCPACQVPSDALKSVVSEATKGET